MSYANRKEMSGNRTVSIIIVALLHVVLGYALVTGLAYNVVKEKLADLKTFDVAEEAPPPEEPPPPPEDIPDVPPPVVAPPPIVRTNTLPPPSPSISVRAPTPPLPSTCVVVPTGPARR